MVRSYAVHMIKIVSTKRYNDLQASRFPFNSRGAYVTPSVFTPSHTSHTSSHPTHTKKVMTRFWLEDKTSSFREPDCIHIIIMTSSRQLVVVGKSSTVSNTDLKQLRGAATSRLLTQQFWCRRRLSRCSASSAAASSPMPMRHFYPCLSSVPY
jgi:hypothetical protein